MLFFQKNDQLETLGSGILEQIWAEFPDLAPNQLALTWLVYDHPVIVNTGGAIPAEDFWQYPLRGYSYRGVETFDPTQLVQLFYLVAIEEWLETEMVMGSPELDRAITNMILRSSHDATSLVVDSLTGTTSGPELSPEPFQTWSYQRNIINRYYQSLGWEELKGANINQKTWSDGYYGRERTFVGQMLENRNRLSAHAIARLLHSIIGGVAVSSERSHAMMRLLQKTHSPADLALPPNAKVWAKGGQSSNSRHIAAYIEIPDHKPYLLVILTQNPESSIRPQLISFISQTIFQAVQQF